MDDIRELIATYPDERSLFVDVQAAADAVDGMDTDILRSPDETRDAFEQALSEVPVEMDETTRLAAANVRFENLPDAETHSVGDERAEDRGHLIALEGQVTKRTEVAPKLEVGVFDCYRCGTEMRIPQGHGKIREPHECHGCEMKNCFRLNKDRSEWTDHQLVQLQQAPEEAVDGATSSINVHLKDDLVGGIEGGNRVTFVGKFEAVPNKGQTRHKRAVRGSSFRYSDGLDDADVSSHWDAIVELSQRPDVFEVLVDSLAPGHEGDRHIKGSLVLQLFKGWPKQYGGDYHRGDSHILLIGDPGVGKSGLFEAVRNVAPRAALTDGTGSSSAGLTAAITKDSFGDAQFTIEAGTLPRANGGLAIVDEIDKGDSDDLDALHSALESQVVHVNKAGRRAELPALTALLAAGNPTGGHFNPKKDFAQQVDIQSPLLSRFDLIYAMQEKVKEDHVSAVADHMVEARDTTARLDRGDDVDADAMARVEPEVSDDLFRAYITYAQRFKPVASDAVKQRIKEFYVDLKTSLPNRYTDDRRDSPPLPVTARKLVAVYRLAEASARTRLSNRIVKEDVDRATWYVNRSLADIGIEPDSSTALGRADNVDASEVGL